MKISSGEHWCCQNDACGCEIKVLVSSKLEGENPRCSCGSVLKKPYTKPQFTNLPAPADLERDENSHSWLRFLKQSTVVVGASSCESHAEFSHDPAS
jgi:hypothetical protein